MLYFPGMHFPLHKVYGFLVEHNSIIGPKGADTDSVVNGHKRFNTGTEGTVIFFAKIKITQVSALVYEILDNIHVTEVAGDHERCNAVIIMPVHIQAVLLHQQLHHFQANLVGVLKMVAVNEPQP